MPLSVTGKGISVHHPADRVEILNTAHDRESFDCGVESLNRYIKQQASQDAKRRIGVTHVAVSDDRPDRILGYYTLATTTIGPGTMPEKNLPKRMALPGALLGRLAVDVSAKGSGLGEFLLMDALARAERVAVSEIGAVAVVVDALPEAVGFYTRYGFQKLLDDELHLYLSMDAIRKLSLNQ